MNRISSIVDDWKDYLAITSDSGYLCILEYDTHCNDFRRIAEYQYGRVGCLYNVPGQYLAVSPSSAFVAVGTGPLLRLIR